MSVIQDITSPMTPMERKSTLALASVYALRMLGLFMMLPVLSLFAESLQGSTPFLMGLAVSLYGLTQAVFQIPFGIWSDRIGRKKIITLGLLLFIIGSIVAALSTTIYGVLIGRALQGSGAISAAVMALVADLTQEVHRTKAMATIGASIGLSFGIAVTVSPMIAHWIGVEGIFWMTAILALFAILTVNFVVPEAPKPRLHRDAEVAPDQLHTALAQAELLKLNYGIFILHLILTATFVVLPLMLRDAGLAHDDQWKIYLGVMVSAIALMIPFVIIAEKKQRMKVVFLGAILLLIGANVGMSVSAKHLTQLILFLGIFFTGFNLLEATLPSLISKTAPADLKGTAMGIYSTSQFLGAFIGGAMGGWIYGKWGIEAVFLFSSLSALSWFLLALSMKSPAHFSSLLLSLENISPSARASLLDSLLTMQGIKEVIMHHEEAVAYLKVDKNELDFAALQAAVAQVSA